MFPKNELDCLLSPAEFCLAIQTSQTFTQIWINTIIVIIPLDQTSFDYSHWINILKFTQFWQAFLSESLW